MKGYIVIDETGFPPQITPRSAKVSPLFYLCAHCGYIQVKVCGYAAGISGVFFCGVCVYQSVFLVEGITQHLNSHRDTQTRKAHTKHTHSHTHNIHSVCAALQNKVPVLVKTGLHSVYTMCSSSSKQYILIVYLGITQVLYLGITQVSLSLVYRQ